MKNDKEKAIKFIKNLTFKEVIGGTLAVFSSFLFIISLFMEITVKMIIYFSMGILLFSLGLGLILLGNVERKNRSLESVNAFIGKQLFEKGLYGIVITIAAALLGSVLGTN